MDSAPSSHSVRLLRLVASGDASAAEPRASDPSPPSSKPPWSRRAFLTAEELATLLRVNRKTVYEALARGEIPGVRRIGGTYRILRDAVLRWFASGQGSVSRSRRKK
jgi:excisionase family DNA binding protein